MKKEIISHPPIHTDPIKPKMSKEEAMEVDVQNVNRKDKQDENKELDMLTIDDIKENVKLIEKAVSSKESRYISRVIRGITSIRKRLNKYVLRLIVSQYFPNVQPAETAWLNFLGEIREDEKETFKPRSKHSSPNVVPEVETYLHLLLLLYSIDIKRLADAVVCSDALISKIVTKNRRMLDLLAAKCYVYHSRAYELTDQLDKIRPFLHAQLRTCSLRSDFEGQATLLNLLLRNYLHYNLFDQAGKLVSKSVFPENSSNNEWARFLYYLGRIRAIKLEYTEAHKNLMQAMRKSPQNTAMGFKLTVQKFAIAVELLLGDIPDHTTFRQPSMRKALEPYFQLTQSVRTGDLAAFNQTLEKFSRQFLADKTYTLIVRLRHNVIKTGVRMINLSYSKIYLSDIAKKLQLDSNEDAKYIVSKAIRDQVIEAKLDLENGFVQSRDVSDIYSTREPMNAFHQRISFCLNIHNQSVKAMRYPPKSYNKDLESAEDRREREQQELESAKEIADEEYDGF